SAAAVRQLLPHLHCDGFGLDCELLTACGHLGLTVTESPVCVRFDDTASTTGWLAGLATLRELWRGRREGRRFGAVRAPAPPPPPRPPPPPPPAPPPAGGSLCPAALSRPPPRRLRHRPRHDGRHPRPGPRRTRHRHRPPGQFAVRRRKRRAVAPLGTRR